MDLQPCGGRTPCSGGWRSWGFTTLPQYVTPTPRRLSPRSQPPSNYPHPTPLLPHGAIPARVVQQLEVVHSSSKELIQWVGAGADVLLCNVLAPVIVQPAPDFARLLKPTGERTRHCWPSHLGSTPEIRICVDLGQ